MAKAKKERAKKYDEKLAISGSFEDVIKVSVSNQTEQNLTFKELGKLMGENRDQLKEIAKKLKSDPSQVVLDELEINLKEGQRISELIRKKMDKEL